MSFDADMGIALKAQPLQDKIYRYVFGETINKITRFSKEDRHILDRDYHIDVELTLQNGIKLLGQEKALRKKFSAYNTFTIEFYQNRHTKEEGEFFNLGAQFYLHGYVNGDTPNEITKFIKCYFIKIFDFLEHLKKQDKAILELSTKPSSGNASFYYQKYDYIPRRFIYWSYDPKPLIGKAR